MKERRRGATGGGGQLPPLLSPCPWYTPIPHYDNFLEEKIVVEKCIGVHPPPPHPDIFKAGAAVARHFALPKQTPLRRPGRSKIPVMGFEPTLLEGMTLFIFQGLRVAIVRIVVRRRWGVDMLYATATRSRKSPSRKSHVRQCSRNRAGRGYLVEVTGSV